MYSVMAEVVCILFLFEDVYNYGGGGCFTKFDIIEEDVADDADCGSV